MKYCNILTGSELAGVWGDASVPDYQDDDGCLRDGLADMYFVLLWPEGCLTRQHFGDCSVHGPFGTYAMAGNYRDGYKDVACRIKVNR